jgi:DinB superfamily
VATDLIPVMRTQFTIVWSLLSFSLDPLTDDECFWSPVADDRTCTVRRNAAGDWVADWSGVETEPYPVATIAWLTWHIGWWWTTTIAHLIGEPVPARTEITWPGTADATKRWLAGLRERWLDILDTLTDDQFAETATFPWASRPDRTVADAIAWVNAELMKNTAEIGQLRIIRTASA